MPESDPICDLALHPRDDHLAVSKDMLLFLKELIGHGGGFYLVTKKAVSQL